MKFDSSRQTVAWFRDRYREGNLAIRPPYQRKPVWVARQKCFLVESLLLEMPVPEIYIHQINTEDGTQYAVVDGQQRIRTVLQFIGCETDPAEEEHNQFVLDKLPADSDFYNLTFSELPVEKKKEFYGYRFTVRYLDTDDEDEVRGMFRRLNRFLTPLNAQELRNSTYQGPFVQLATKLAEVEFWAENRIVTASSIRRMGDVEFVSELLIGIMHGPQGGGARIIDEYYQQFEDFEADFPEQRRTERLYDQSLKLVQALLPDIKETRWSNKTDFYSLFVATGAILRSCDYDSEKSTEIRAALDRFEEAIDECFNNGEKHKSAEVVSYVRAVQRGANEKSRRANRHNALLTYLGPYFTPKKEQGATKRPRVSTPGRRTLSKVAPAPDGRIVSSRS